MPAISSNKIHSIQKFIDDLTRKIKTLCDDKLNTKYIAYIDKLLRDREIYIKRDEFKKIDSDYQKLKKKLADFQLTIVQDCAELMQIAGKMDLEELKFNDIKEEYNKLSRDLGLDSASQVNRSSNSAQYLSSLIQVQGKAQKIKKSYNDSIRDFNTYVTNFNLFIGELRKGSIIYTSPHTKKYYSIVLIDIVNDIISKISLSIGETSNDLQSKRKRVLSSLGEEYHKKLEDLLRDDSLEKITGLLETGNP